MAPASPLRRANRPHRPLLLLLVPRCELLGSLAPLVRPEVVSPPLRLELLVVSDEPLVPVPLAVAPLAHSGS